MEQKKDLQSRGHTFLFSCFLFLLLHLSAVVILFQLCVEANKKKVSRVKGGYIEYGLFPDCYIINESSTLLP